MAKTTLSADETRSDNQLASAVRESAEQIWLAGLGAFAKAQQEGTKVFDALVREGDLLQQRTRAATEHRLEEAANRFTEAATHLSRQATQSWDRLEQVFEDRVARALSHLGVPSSRDIRELTEMLQALNQRISALDVEPTARPRASAAKAAPAAATLAPARRGAHKGSRAVVGTAAEPAVAPPAARIPAPGAKPARRSRTVS
jgi:poly(hydroxyalkanoate) granule-associated protein